MKLLTYILTTFIYIQSFAVYAYEAKFEACHKYGQQSSAHIIKHPAKKIHECCKDKSSNKTSDSKGKSCKSKNDKSCSNDCCGDMCKCQHVNHSLVLSLLPQDITNSLLSNNIPDTENTKSNIENLHGYDPLDNILQPPRL